MVRVPALIRWFWFSGSCFCPSWWLAQEGDRELSHRLARAPLWIGCVQVTEYAGKCQSTDPQDAIWNGILGETAGTFVFGNFFGIRYSIDQLHPRTDSLRVAFPPEFPGTAFVVLKSRRIQE